MDLAFNYKRLRDEVGATGTAVTKRRASAQLGVASRRDHVLWGLGGMSAASAAVTVPYRRHPRFARTVYVHRTRPLGDQQFVRCGLMPDPEAHATEIPMWIFDAGASNCMHPSNRPTMSMEALRESKSLLTLARRPLNASDPALQRQSGHRDLSSKGRRSCQPF